MKNQPSMEELELQLRVLGRHLGEDRPSPELVSRTTAASVAHLSVCISAARRRWQLVIGSALLAAASLPIPLLFLWGDWTAASALFGRVLSPAASEIASSVYLWVRICALTLIYVLLIPSVTWWGLRMNSGANDLEVRHA